jgi:hypothetical protein
MICIFNPHASKKNDSVWQTSCTRQKS